MATLRWEGDERGVGVADASPLAAGVVELVDAMQLPGWVAEDPQRAFLFDVVTGILAGDSQFVPHGHTVRLRVSVPAQQADA